MKVLILCLALFAACTIAAPKAKDAAEAKTEVKLAAAAPEVDDEELEELEMMKEMETDEDIARDCMKGWQKCTDKSDGDYADCDTCNGYVSCSGGVRHSGRPCPAKLEWDNYNKRCDWVSPTCGETRRQSTGCQNNNNAPNAAPMEIECESNRVIQVRWAYYGRRRPSKRVCEYPIPHIDDTECLGNPRGDRNYVRSVCNGLNSCVIYPKNWMFGENPCYGTYKYLRVGYSCVLSAAASSDL